MTTAPQLLSIAGMSCAGCVRRVETALNEVPGVTSASVNFASQTAAVLGSSSLDSLLSAVAQAGYSAVLFQPESIREQEEAARSALHLAISRSGIALLGGVLLMLDMHLGLLPGLERQLLWSSIGGLVLLVLLLAGGHFYVAAWTSLRHGTATMDSLISLGTGTAWLYSMLVVLMPELVPEASRHQFFEAALFVIGFVNLGKALETNARSRASVAIQKLFDLTPQYVTRLLNGAEEVVPLEIVQEGDELRVRPGEYLPVDGVVISGISSVDQSMLTGESEAVVVETGGAVCAGTLNIDSSVIVRAEAVGSETVLGGMIRLIAEAQNSKPPIADLVDRISSVFVPAVVGLALLTAALWWFFGPPPQLSFALVTAMSVLIIACPCALGLAIPMSIMVGLGRAANQGLLVRNSEVLERAANIDLLVVDKTGTLTLGEPRVTAMRGLNDESLAIALALESQSEHPLARAIQEFCLGQSIVAADVAGFSNHPGGGVSASLGGETVALGNEVFLQSLGIKAFPETEGTVSYLVRGDQVVGYFVLEDQVRDDAARLVRELAVHGVDVVMLSGDRPEVAEQVANGVGIATFKGRCLPEDKLDYITEQQAQGRIVGMAGDGINDSAALACADIGFAMGGGTDIAKESADIILLEASLRGIKTGIDLSRSITRNIRQNLVAAFAYNLLLIPVAAGILYPFTGILIDPALAGLAMALSSVSVVFNAGRLRFA
ncbi:MAG: heavy metal translocating P-type ATPase [Pseudomonadales bacterium]|nr:heavy metal translocating P-type ATPase [Pseudomonadales bacterium]